MEGEVKMKIIYNLSIVLLLVFMFILIPSAVKGQSDDINLEKGLITFLQLKDEGKEITDSAGDIKGIKYGTTVQENSLYFDGEDDYIELNNYNLSNLGKGTISLWFRAQDIPTDNAIRPILYYGAQDPCTNMPDASNQGLIIEVAHDPMHFNSRNLYFTIFADGCDYPSFCYDSRKPMEENKWYHFVAIVGEDYNTGFLNGQEMTNRRYNFGTERYSQFFEDAVRDEAMWIGKGYWAAEPMFFKGNIKNIRIYDRVLNKQEIKYLYENGI